MAFAFAQKQRACFYDFETELLPGLVTGQKIIPVERAGVYIPAGKFPLLSSAVMTICPALAAGVKEIVVCTPPRKNQAGQISPNVDHGILGALAVCFAIKEAAVQPRIFAIGGAQAVAAMAYGTRSVPACDVIAGPGNKYVSEAKRQIFGAAGIDILAGPTEVLIIACGRADARLIAADMLAQAEHDEDAQAVLVTRSDALAKAVQREIDFQLAQLATAQTARAALKSNGCIILVDSLEEAAAVANKKAPEHLELAVFDHAEREFFTQNLRNYGSLFIGHTAAEVLGDYSAGLNHTLPTSGAARWTGGLSVRCFLKTVTTLSAQKGEGTERALKAAAVLGNAEGLAAHAAAAKIRLNESF
jgi:histidinol dehydrogenase